MLEGREQATTIADAGSFDLKNMTGIIHPAAPNRLYYHFVFTANINFSSASNEVRAKFYKYMGVCAKVLDARLQTFGGKDAYMHLLVSLERNQTPFDFIWRMKLLTAAWAKRNMHLTNFKWVGADASTVSLSERKETMRSIRRRTEGVQARGRVRLVIA